MSEKVMREHLERKAILYVRQSSLRQVERHPESRKLQYAMQRRLEDLGFHEVEVIDDDLGVTASGVKERAGFERVVAEVCLGKVGVVSARQVCRLARNNPDWHRLVEMCRYVNTLLIDLENVYDPRNSNDRLLLGVKGNLSVYELDTMRQRAGDAARAKAERGELFVNVPAGYVRGSGDTLFEKNPDLRVQRMLQSVFDKFLEVGSLSQTVMWYWDHDLLLPVNHRSGRGSWELQWCRPTISMLSRIVNNPIYAGAYAYGRRKLVYDVRGEVVRRSVRRLPREQWAVLIRDHHEGYISWETHERIQEMLARNAASWGSSGAARGGSSVLVGLLRCRRCGRKLRTTYSGEPRVQRYVCDQSTSVGGGLTCLGFGGRWLDDAVEREVLRVISPGSLDAARLAAEESERKKTEVVDALRLELEAERYAADHARRQYEAVDPLNRLVAGELERRWEVSLEKAGELERRVREEEPRLERSADSFESGVKALSEDLPRVWNDPETDVRLKKRIVRSLIEEVIVDAEGSEIQAVIHWKGGVHTELTVRRRRRGQHGKATSKDTVDAVRILSLILSDRGIAQVLSRNELRTGQGNRWSRERVKGLRRWNDIPVYSKERRSEEGWMTLGQAAEHVSLTPKTLRRAAERGEVVYQHPLSQGPWVFNRKNLELPEVEERFARIRRSRKTPAGPASGDATPMIPGTW